MTSEQLSYKEERKLLKKLYFWLFIAFGMISPFATIFFKKVLVDDVGNPDVKLIGIILSFASATGLVANILTGYLSDKLQKGRRIISWLCILAFFSAILIGLTGEPAVMNLSLQHRFIILLITVLIYRFAMMPLNALLDSETMQHLNKHSDRKHFGSYRFWGTIGWAVATPIMGAILFFTNRYTMIHYVGAFGFLVFGFLGLKSTNSVKLQKVSINWKSVFKDRAFMLFLTYSFLVGVIESSTSNYIGYFFDDVMSTPLMIGAMFSIWTAIEIPVMLYSRKLINRFGNSGLVIAGLVCNAIKLFMFSRFTLETPFYFQLIAALLHGPSFALLFLGLIDIVDRLSPNSMKATYMSVTAIARSTLAGIIGGALGGVIIAKIGGAGFMFVSAIASVILIPLFFVFYRGKAA